MEARVKFVNVKIPAATVNNPKSIEILFGHVAILLDDSYDVHLLSPFIFYLIIIQAACQVFLHIKFS
jgi:hypothetical protein